MVGEKIQAAIDKDKLNLEKSLMDGVSRVLIKRFPSLDGMGIKIYNNIIVIGSGVTYYLVEIDGIYLFVNTGCNPIVRKAHKSKGIFKKSWKLGKVVNRLADLYE